MGGAAVLLVPGEGTLASGKALVGVDDEFRKGGDGFLPVGNLAGRLGVFEPFAGITEIF